MEDLVNIMNYRDAMGAIIVYDITNQESFNNTASWVQDVRNNTNNNNINIMLLGNKSDLMKGRKVTAENGKIFSRNNDLRQSWNNIEDIYLLTKPDQVVPDLFS